MIDIKEDILTLSVEVVTGKLAPCWVQSMERGFRQDVIVLQLSYYSYCKNIIVCYFLSTFSENGSTRVTGVCGCTFKAKMSRKQYYAIVFILELCLRRSVRFKKKYGT